MLNTLYRLLGSFISPSGKRSELSILIYHRVLDKKDPLFPNEVTTEVFDQQLSLLKNVFNVLPLPEAILRLKSSSLPARPLCITFDDGYSDNFGNALPILKKHRLTATFFIATAYLNGGRMFNDTIIHSIRHCQEKQINLSCFGLGKYDLDTIASKSQAISSILNCVKYLPLGKREETAEGIANLLTNEPFPTDIMMSTQDIKEIFNCGMTIGAHTVNHPILSKLDIKEAEKEIADGKEHLEWLTGEKISLFAYPNGKPFIDYLPEHVNLVKNMGFESAVSTAWGSSNKNIDLFQLPRFTPYQTKAQYFIPSLLNNLIR